MYIRVKKRKDIITVGDSFMNLTTVTDDLITGTVKYSVDQVKLIQDVQNAGSIVRITFSTKNPQKIDSIRNINPKLHPELVSKAVTTLYRDAVEYAKNLEEANVLQVYADSTSKVNNQLMAAVKSNHRDGFDTTQTRTTKYMLRTVKQVGDAGNFAPVMHATSLQKSDAATFNPKNSLRTMLVTERLDPSTIIEQSLPHLNSKESLAGTHNKKFDVSPTLNDFYRHIIRTPSTGFGSTEHFSDQEKILVVQNTLNNQVNVSKDFTLPYSSIKNTDGTFKTMFVFFEVLDRLGVMQQQTEKLIDLSRAVEVFQTPRIAPSVSVYKNARSLIGSLRIQQNDPDAKFVNLYRKLVSHVSSETQDYLYLSQVELIASEGEKIVSVDVPAGSSIIYRVIPVSSTGIESFEFTNVVMTSTARDRRFKHASLAFKITDNGVVIEVREISPEAVSFDIVRKNRTLFDKNYSTVTTSTILVESGQTQYQIVDSSVKRKHVYEYAAVLFFKDGRKSTVGNIIVEYVPAADSIVDTKVTNLVVTLSPDPNVTFDLETNVVSTDTSTLTKLLSQNNLLGFFSTDVLKERSKLDDLICYEIQRQDLTVGVIENFGIVSEKTFSDEKLRVITSVSPLKTGRQYRYVVTTLLRSPETLFEDFSKDAIDATTKKKYSYRPFKFFQPVTLERGSVTTSTSLKLNHAKDPFAFGNVGSFATAEVFLDKTVSSVTDAKAETIFDDFIVVRWKYNGSLDDVDHFIIMKEFQGMRSMVGKSHALSGNRTLQYIKKMSHDDMGELAFIIIPVFSDYQLGAEVRSNLITVMR